MTKEELAEEYADKYKPNFVVNEYGSTVYTQLDIEQAFLAGYETMEAYNEKLLDGDIEKHNKIVELKEQLDALVNVNIKAQNIIGKAKEIIKRVLKATYGEGWNYSLQVKVEAEKFLKESE